MREGEGKPLRGEVAGVDKGYPNSEWNRGGGYGARGEGNREEGQTACGCAAVAAAKDALYLDRGATGEQARGITGRGVWQG